MHRAGVIFTLTPLQSEDTIFSLFSFLWRKGLTKTDVPKITSTIIRP